MTGIHTGSVAANGDAPESPVPSLAVDLGGMRLATPVVAASGCFNTGREMGELVDLSRVGGIVTKSVTLNPRKGMPVPRMAETSSGMLNAIGLQNVGVGEFRAQEAPWIESVLGSTPVIVSVAEPSSNFTLIVALWSASKVIPFAVNRRHQLVKPVAIADFSAHG